MQQIIDDQIDKRIGEVRTESLDISFGEIISLYKNKELIIQPEYQRLFRWSNQQKSRLIESVLLELPIPQIFTIENRDGVLELIDGLQRISSVIQFIDSEILEREPLQLEGCDQIKELNDKTYNDLSTRLRLRLKRSSVRTVIIKRQSKSFLRYEMFKRLNTGGSILAPQEIRNCSSRMLGENGIKFYGFLQEMSENRDFCTCTETLSQAERDQKGDEELVLRFFAAKNKQELFRGSVRDWLDNYMEEILLEKIEFDYEQEKQDFEQVFSFLAKAMGESAFVSHRENSPIGALAPSYFEAVSIGMFKALKAAHIAPANYVKDSILRTIQSDDFKKNVGPGASSKSKLANRIDQIEKGLTSLHSLERF